MTAAGRIPQLLARCLVNRGLGEVGVATGFLNPRLKDLADPFLLPDMGRAVDRLLAAREAGDRLVIVGDYDVDGVTSTALLLEVLERLGWRVDAYLPGRMEEGYGLTEGAVDNCLAKFPARVLLALDCGSTAVATIEGLGRRGVDVIVVDHHQVSEPIPPAVALVNPQRGSVGVGRDFRELASVGLAFKLAHALVKRGREAGWTAAHALDLRPLLDLVAVGTIADLVPLTGENRILVAAGLERLAVTGRPGLRALMAVSGTSGAVGVQEVAYQLGPRLNAAGRLENAERALRLLRARDEGEARPLAEELDARNRQRQEIERSIVEPLTAEWRARFDPARDFAIVEGRLLWHIGVLGIVASRLVREFYRPTLIVGGEGDEWRGSGRSIEGFDLAAALRECDDLLIRHGGHAMAAGVTVHPDKVDALRERLNGLVQRRLSPEQMRPVLRLDAEVVLAEITLERVEELGRLEPVGQGNPPVHLVARGLRHQRPARPLGREGKHLKLWVTDGTTVHEAVWWNCREGKAMPEPFDLAFAPQINEYDGRRTVQLRVLDWRRAG